MDSLRLILRRGKVKNNDSVAYIFDTIWLNGCNPEVAYEQVECKSKRTLEEAIPWYLEKLKEENQMEWVRRMRNLENRAEEIVKAELIYTFERR